MVEPSKRTRSRKKVKVRTPGGRTTTHFRSEKAGRVGCGRCGKQLSGVASGSPTQIKSLSKSRRRPARPYAGVLCPNCLDALVRYVTRMEVKHSAPEYGDLEVERDLTLEKFLARGWWGMVTSGHIKKTTRKEKPKTKKAEGTKTKRKKPAKAKTKAKS